MQTTPAPPGPAAPAPSQRSHLFISYSHSDRIAVDKLVADLRARGYPLWMDVDVRGIEPGEVWKQELIRQMSGAAGVIACVSPDFLTSPYCKAEIDQARAENKPIFPVIVRRLNAGQGLDAFGLDSLQFVDLTQDYNGGLTRLLNALPAPRRLPIVLRTAALIGGVVAILILALLFVATGTQLGLSAVATPIPPTATVSFAGVDLGVIVSYFALDLPPSLPEAEAKTLTAQAGPLIERLAGALDQQLASDLSKTGLAISYKLIGPAGIPPVGGSSPIERREAAVALAKARGAGVVVYGAIHYNEALRQLELAPEFYVATSRYFSDALDLTGGYALGQRVPADSLSERGKLSGRVAALSYIVTGLFQHVTRDYTGALASYNAALALPNWDDQNGKEVLYALIGQTQLKRAESAASRCDRATVLARVADGEAAYTTSQQIADALRPHFPRAYAGLANAYAFKALWLPERNDGCAAQLVNVAALQTALDYIGKYRGVLDPQEPEEPGVTKKLQLTEAQVDFLLWAVPDANRTAAQREAQYQAFVKMTDRIIADYETALGRDDTWASPVMEAHILRGQAVFARGDNRAAIAEYDQALRIYTDGKSTLLAPERVMTVYGWEGDAYLRLRDYPTAAQWYGKALETAKALKNQAAITRYQAAQARADAFALASPTPTQTATPRASLTPTAAPSTALPPTPTEEMF
jgi:tetratricopeptide (TPR) repeat protein